MLFSYVTEKNEMRGGRRHRWWRSEGYRGAWLVGFAVDAGGDEFDETFIAQELELLADFGFDVVVAGVTGFQLVNKGVHLLQGEGGA